MTLLMIEDAVEQIKKTTDKETIEKITIELMEKLSSTVSRNGKNKGVQITEKTFLNGHRKVFIDSIKKIENVPENLKSGYKGHLNHHAITVAYEFKYQKIDAETTVQNPVETTKETPKPHKKAVKLDATKLIDLAIKWLESDNFYLIGIGVALLTGRRQSEIYFYTTFKADDENTMIVQYLSKKRGENYKKQFRIPVLCNSDLIENAVEKIRKLAPMDYLYEIVNNSKNVELGLKLAREKFNDSYSSEILKVYNGEARPYFQDCEDKELKNDKDYFHGIRAVYASLFYHLVQQKYGCSVNDAVDYVKECLSHDTDGIALKYTEFNFINLPSVENFDDSVFSIENICEVPYENNEDVKIELNLTELLQKLDINSQQELSKKLTENENIESVFATFIIKATRAMMVNQAVNGDVENEKPKLPDARDKIGNIVLAMIQHNHNQELIEDENERIYYAINPSSIDNVSKHLTGKNIDKITLKNTCKNLETKINDCHNSLRLSEKLASRKNPDGTMELANYHLRGEKNRDKLEIVVNSIKEIYEKQYSL